MADRLDCPFCRTALNPGAFVCPACGAARGRRSPSLLAIVVAFPLIGFAAGVAVLIFGGSSSAFLATWICVTLGLAVTHTISRQQVEWVRGAEAGGVVVEAAASAPAHRATDEKTCPQCAETVKRAAKLCRFCGFSFADGAEIIDVESTPVADAPNGTITRGLGGLPIRKP